MIYLLYGKGYKLPDLVDAPSLYLYCWMVMLLMHMCGIQHYSAYVNTS